MALFELADAVQQELLRSNMGTLSRRAAADVLSADRVTAVYNHFVFAANGAATVEPAAFTQLYASLLDSSVSEADIAAAAGSAPLTPAAFFTSLQTILSAPCNHECASLLDAAFAARSAGCASRACVGVKHRDPTVQLGGAVDDALDALVAHKPMAGRPRVTQRAIEVRLGKLAEAATAAPSGTVVIRVKRAGRIGPGAASTRGRVHVQGEGFAPLVNDVELCAELTAAVAADLACLFSVPPAQVKVERLAVGSLIVDFTVEADQANKGEHPSDIMAKHRDDISWMTSTNQVYRDATGNSEGLRSGRTEEMGAGPRVNVQCNENSFVTDSGRGSEEEPIWHDEFDFEAVRDGDDVILTLWNNGTKVGTRRVRVDDLQEGVWNHRWMDLDMESGVTKLNDRNAAVRVDFNATGVGLLYDPKLAELERALDELEADPDADPAAIKALEDAIAARLDKLKKLMEDPAFRALMDEARRLAKDPNADPAELDRLLALMEQREKELDGATVEGNVMVAIKGARGLPEGADPYVEVKVGDQKQRTESRPGARNPIWNEQWPFHVADANKEPVAVSLVNQHQNKADEVLGRASVPLTDLKEGEEKECWVPMAGVPGAEVLVGLTPMDFTTRRPVFASEDPVMGDRVVAYLAEQNDVPHRELAEERAEAVAHRMAEDPEYHKAMAEAARLNADPRADSAACEEAQALADQLGRNLAAPEEAKLALDPAFAELQERRDSVVASAPTDENVAVAEGKLARRANELAKLKRDPEFASLWADAEELSKHPEQQRAADAKRAQLAPREAECKHMEELADARLAPELAADVRDLDVLRRAHPEEGTAAADRLDELEGAVAQQRKLLEPRKARLLRADPMVEKLEGAKLAAESGPAAKKNYAEIVPATEALEKRQDRVAELTSDPQYNRLLDEVATLMEEPVPDQRAIAKAREALVARERALADLKAMPHEVAVTIKRARGLPPATSQPDRARCRVSIPVDKSAMLLAAPADREEIKKALARDLAKLLAGTPQAATAYVERVVPGLAADINVPVNARAKLASAAGNGAWLAETNKAIAAIAEAYGERAPPALRPSAVEDIPEGNFAVIGVNGGDEHVTEPVRQQDGAAVWREPEMRFKLADPETGKARVEVFDNGVRIGTATIPLAELQRGKATTRWLPLTEGSHPADVEVVIRPVTFGVDLNELMNVVKQVDPTYKQLLEDATEASTPERKAEIQAAIAEREKELKALLEKDAPFRRAAMDAAGVDLQKDPVMAGVVAQALADAEARAKAEHQAELMLDPKYKALADQLDELRLDPAANTEAIGQLEEAMAAREKRLAALRKDPKYNDLFEEMARLAAADPVENAPKISELQDKLAKREAELDECPPPPRPFRPSDDPKYHAECDAAETFLKEGGEPMPVNVPPIRERQKVQTRALLALPEEEKNALAWAGEERDVADELTKAEQVLDRDREAPLLATADPVAKEAAHRLAHLLAEGGPTEHGAAIEAALDAIGQRGRTLEDKDLADRYEEQLKAAEENMAFMEKGGNPCTGRGIRDITVAPYSAAHLDEVAEVRGPMLEAIRADPTNTAKIAELAAQAAKIAKELAPQDEQMAVIHSMDAAAANRNALADKLEPVIAELEKGQAFDVCDDAPFRALHEQAASILAVDPSSKKFDQVREALAARAAELENTPDDEKRSAKAEHQGVRARRIAMGLHPVTGEALAELTNDKVPRAFNLRDDGAFRKLHKKALDQLKDPKAAEDVDKTLADLAKRARELSTLNPTQKAEAAQAAANAIRREAEDEVLPIAKKLSDDILGPKAFQYTDDSRLRGHGNELDDAITDGAPQKKFDKLLGKMAARAAEIDKMEQPDRDKLADRRRRDRAMMVAHGINPLAADGGNTDPSAHVWKPVDDDEYRRLAEEVVRCSAVDPTDRHAINDVLDQLKARGAELEQMPPEERELQALQAAQAHAVEMAKERKAIAALDPAYAKLTDDMRIQLRHDPLNHERLANLKGQQLARRSAVRDAVPPEVNGDDEEAKNLRAVAELPKEYAPRRIAVPVPRCPPRPFELCDDAKYNDLFEEYKDMHREGVVGPAEQRLPELQDLMENREKDIDDLSPEEKRRLHAEGLARELENAKNVVGEQKPARLAQRKAGGGDEDAAAAEAERERQRLAREAHLRKEAERRALQEQLKRELDLARIRKEADVLKRKVGFRFQKGMEEKRSPDEQTTIARHFCFMDPDSVGALTPADMHRLYFEVLNGQLLTPADVDTLADRLDTDRDGVIDAGEFEAVYAVMWELELPYKDSKTAELLRQRRAGAKAESPSDKQLLDEDELRRRMALAQQLAPVRPGSSQSRGGSPSRGGDYEDPLGFLGDGRFHYMHDKEFRDGVNLLEYVVARIAHTAPVITFLNKQEIKLRKRAEQLRSLPETEKEALMKAKTAFIPVISVPVVRDTEALGEVATRDPLAAFMMKESERVQADPAVRDVLGTRHAIDEMTATREAEIHLERAPDLDAELAAAALAENIEPVEDTFNEAHGWPEGEAIDPTLKYLNEQHEVAVANNNGMRAAKIKQLLLIRKKALAAVRRRHGPFRNVDDEEYRRYFDEYMEYVRRFPLEKQREATALRPLLQRRSEQLHLLTLGEKEQLIAAAIRRDAGQVASNVKQDRMRRRARSLSLSGSQTFDSLAPVRGGRGRLNVGAIDDDAALLAELERARAAGDVERIKQIEARMRERQELLDKMRRDEEERKAALRKAEEEEKRRKREQIEARRRAGEEKRQQIEAEKKRRMEELMRKKESEEHDIETARRRKQAEILRKKALIRSKRGLGTETSALTEEELAVLREHFDRIDSQGSGKIDHNEFVKFYNELLQGNLTRKELDMLFDALDTGSGGELTFDEFVQVYTLMTAMEQAKKEGPARMREFQDRINQRRAMAKRRGSGVAGDGGGDEGMLRSRSSYRLDRHEEVGPLRKSISRRKRSAGSMSGCSYTPHPPETPLSRRPSQRGDFMRSGSIFGDSVSEATGATHLRRRRSARANSAARSVGSDTDGKVSGSAQGENPEVTRLREELLNCTDADERVELERRLEERRAELLRDAMSARQDTRAQRAEDDDKKREAIRARRADRVSQVERDRLAAADESRAAKESERDAENERRREAMRALNAKRQSSEPRKPEATDSAPRRVQANLRRRSASDAAGGPAEGANGEDRPASSPAQPNPPEVDATGAPQSGRGNVGSRIAMFEGGAPLKPQPPESKRDGGGRR